jgi:hypothetical protein
MNTITQVTRDFADKLDGRDRYVLLWIERQMSVAYDEVSGETLNTLLALQLVKLNPTKHPRATWPVTCTDLGKRVTLYIRTCKTVAPPKGKIDHG